MNPNHRTANWLGMTLLGILLSACSMAAQRDPEIFRVGELEVWLYQDQSRLARDLTSIVGLSDAMKIGNRQLKIFGYYDRQNQRIYSINDARILLHEFRHFLEPHWKHELGTISLEPWGERRQSACVDCRIDTAENNAMDAPASPTTSRQ